MWSSARTADERSRRRSLSQLQGDTVSAEKVIGTFGSLPIGRFQVYGRSTEGNHEKAC
jgi:hypothetical protein